MIQISEQPRPFAVDGRPDLTMVVYNPATPDDAARLQTLMGLPDATA